jgi:hypothetical protein
VFGGITLLAVWAAPMQVNENLLDLLSFYDFGVLIFGVPNFSVGSQNLLMPIDPNVL